VTTADVLKALGLRIPTTWSSVAVASCGHTCWPARPSPATQRGYLRSSSADSNPSCYENVLPVVAEVIRVHCRWSMPVPLIEELRHGHLPPRHDRTVFRIVIGWNADGHDLRFRRVEQPELVKVVTLATRSSGRCDVPSRVADSGCATGKCVPPSPVRPMKDVSPNTGVRPFVSNIDNVGYHVQARHEG